MNLLSKCSIHFSKNKMSQFLFWSERRGTINCHFDKSKKWLVILVKDVNELVVRQVREDRLVAPYIRPLRTPI